VKYISPLNIYSVCDKVISYYFKLNISIHDSCVENGLKGDGLISLITFPLYSNLISVNSVQSVSLFVNQYLLCLPNFMYGAKVSKNKWLQLDWKAILRTTCFKDQTFCAHCYSFRLIFFWKNWCSKNKFNQPWHLSFFAFAYFVLKYTSWFTLE